MPEPGLLLLTLAGAVIAAFAPLRYALGTVLAFLLLVPTTLIVPRAPSALILVDRVVLYAFVVGLVLRWSRGELRREVFRPTVVHVAFGVFLALGLVLGVFLGPLNPFVVLLNPWLRLLDGFLVFGSVLVAVRALGDLRRVVGIVGGLVLLVSGVAMAEFLTEASWGRWLSQAVPEHARTSAAQPLRIRGDSVRVRVAGEFAVDFAWILVVVAPFAVAAVTRARRLAVKALAAAPVVAVFWTFTRSATIGLIIVLLVLWAASRFDGSMGRLLAAGAIVAFVAAMVAPTSFDPFSSQQAEDSLETRASRLSVGAGLAAERPIVGHGFTGLAAEGLTGTDMSYLHVFGELGVLGLTSLVVLLVIALVSTGRGLRGPPSSSLAAAAGFASIVGAALAAASYDFFGFSSTFLWFGAGIGVAAAERRDERWRDRWASPSPRRLLPAVAGLGVGLVIALTAPTHAGQDYSFEALPTAIEAGSVGDPNHLGEIFVNSACGLAQGVANDRTDVKVACRHTQITWVGRLEVRAPDVETVEEVRGDLAEAFERLGDVVIHPLDPPRSGRPTAARTAPIWLPGGLLLLGLLLPPGGVFGGRRRPRRRRQPAAPEPRWEDHRLKPSDPRSSGAWVADLQPR